MIVFTIYKNGGNAGAFGASFGCAVFCVRGSSGVNAAESYAGRALFNWGGIVRFDWGNRLSQLGIGSRFCLRAVVLAVLNGYSRT